MSERRALETVFIDSLSGLEFEDLCARIYRNLGHKVENIQSTGDEGRDLIIESPSGKITVAECKHYLGRTVGRPVLQKLHSAIVTYPAEYGALITTGSFAKQVFQYVEKVDEDIELIDWARLRSLALTAGINILSSADPMGLTTYPINSDTELKADIDNLTLRDLNSVPRSADELFQLKTRELIWQPIYLAHYDLKQTFSSSVGVLLDINESDHPLMINGVDGSLVSDEVTSHLASTKGIPMDRPPGLEDGSTAAEFAIGTSEITGLAKDHIRSQHTTIVHYRGKNKQGYSKQCIPNNKSISVKDVVQVYVPEQIVTLAALLHQYELKLIEGDPGIFWLAPPEVSVCGHCEKELLNQRQGSLCNSCGAIAHRRSYWFPHSLECTACGKTICRTCSHWEHRMLLFKRILCSSCAETRPDGTTRRLVASS